MEEYKLLSDHYFHEDKLFWVVVSIFASINGALFAFLGSTFVAHNLIGRVLIPLIGIVLCVAWFAALVRVREYRVYIELRIRTIEVELNQFWKVKGFLPLDIRRMEGWVASEPASKWYGIPWRALRNMPASKTLRFLPVSFMVIWAGSIIGYSLDH